MNSGTPWHVPGRWHAVPAWWELELPTQFPNLPQQVRLVDCSMAEGPDAVGCHLGWKARVELAERLDDAGVGAITTPGGTTYREVVDWVKQVRRNGVKAQIVAKVAGIRPPLREGWKDTIDRYIDIGGDVLLLASFWEWSDMVSNFQDGLSIPQVVEAVQEGVRYAKQQGAHVNYSHGDQMRHRLETTLTFYRAALDAGADSIYLWDSRGNCNPLTAYHFVSKFKELAGDKPIYVQFHNDLGMATGNSFAAAAAGATMLDCSVVGIGDRGGCVSLEEIACALELYGIDSGIKLEKLYELGQFAESAFSVQTQIWKPIVGRGAFMENGWGHRESGDPEETSAGLAPSVVGRGPFEAMLGGRVFSDRDKRFWTDVLELWGYSYTPEDLDEIRARTMHSIISRRGAIDLDEFRAICEGVLGNAVTGTESGSIGAVPASAD